MSTDIEETIIGRHDDSDWLLAYWVTDAHGLPANGGDTDPEWAAQPDTIQTVEGDLAICPGRSKVGLHATTKPHRWAGDRVWLVAVKRPVKRCGDKLASLTRHILTDIRPHQVMSQSVAARLGMGSRLRHADLRHADLRRANLRNANLQDANLRDANLRGADLQDANLRGADLQDANLRDANLRGADFWFADLRDANLWGARIDGVRGDLSEAMTGEGAT